MNYMEKIYGIILSAGFGSRMNSDVPKGMFLLKGKPFIEYTLDTFSKLNLEDKIVVLNYKKEMFNEVVRKYNLKVAIQEELNGTAKAVESTKEILENKDGCSLIVPVDSMLVSKELYKELIDHHFKNKNDLTILSTELDNPFSYGRIIRNDMKFLKIVEEADCNQEEKLIKEINGGIYIVNNKVLFESLSKVKNNNKRKEYYLTDIAQIMKDAGYKVDAYMTNRTNELLSVNDMEMLDKVIRVLDNK